MRPGAPWPGCRPPGRDCRNSFSQPRGATTRYTGTLEPWNPGTLEPWNPGTGDHRRLIKTRHGYDLIPLKARTPRCAIPAIWNCCRTGCVRGVPIESLGDVAIKIIGAD
jgi:hypothetical protein